MAQMDFDPTQHEPDEGFPVIPAGEYDIIFTQCDITENSKKTGTNIKHRAKILTGPFKNQMLFSTMSYKNPSKQAEKITAGKLTAIARAIGHEGKFTDTSQFLHKPLTTKVKVTTYNGTLKSEMDSFKARSAPSNSGPSVTEEPASGPVTSGPVPAGEITNPFA